jgi:DnaK suppressor protein
MIDGKRPLREGKSVATKSAATKSVTARTAPKAVPKVVPKPVAKGAAATAKAVAKVPAKAATKPPAVASVAPKSFPAPRSAPAKPAAKKSKELTEQELLEAPEKDYMNEAQLAFFRQRLLELRAQLLNNADDTGQHLRENEVTTDPSDRATLEEEYTLELRTRDRERKLLKKIEKSIKLIDDGSYGYCEETGEPIGVARLLARPTATLSLEAQERRERVQKLYGD